MLHTDRIDTIDQLRAIAPEWNELWQRSRATSALHRAESLLSFLEHFSMDGRLYVFTVRENGRLLAALPIVETRRFLKLAVVGLPINEWSLPGTLLLDAEADPQPILLTLLDELSRSGFWLVRLDQIDVDSPDWAEFLAGVKKKRMPHETVSQYKMGTVDTRADFETLIAGRSKNLRSTLRRRRRRLEEMGVLRFTMVDRFSPEPDGQPLEPLFRKMFELEEKSWKKEAGGTVLGTPGIFDFYVELGQLMSEGGFLRVAMLEHEDRLIAYDLAVESKGVYHSYKVSYDPDFNAYGPGQLLHESILSHACASPAIEAVHFCGPMDDAIAAWSDESHTIDRLSFTSRGFGHRLLWLAYRTAAVFRRSL